MSIIHIENLSKTYASGVTALDGVSFDIQAGDFFALLGPNGAGKSTLINVLSSLVQKTGGKVAIAGHDIDTHSRQAKLHLGVMPQEINLGVFDKVLPILINQAGYYGVPKAIAKKRALDLLDRLSLSDKADQVTRSLSGGMKRRVMIARALMNDPDIIILDEPTAGVDIEIRQHMWDFLKDLNKAGKTIILTTHYLEEAEQLCDNVAIIDRGKLVCQSDMPSLLRHLDCEQFVLYLSEPLQNLPDIPELSIRQIDSLTLEVDVPRDLGISRCLYHLCKANILVQSLRNKTNRLESLFLKLTKREGL